MEAVLNRLVRERTMAKDRMAFGLVVAGAAVLLAALAVGAWLALQTGGLFEPGVTARISADGVRRLRGLSAATPAWLMPMSLAALSGFMVAVAVVLRRITATITLRRDALVAIGARER